MRNIEITAEQAQVIQNANNEVLIAQRILDRVLAAVLAGEGVLNAEVRRMDTDSSPPVLVIADPATGNSRMTPETAQAIDVKR